MNALILVDIQNDFLPGGALAVPDGDAIIWVANEIQSNFDLIVATQDWHPANHRSFASQNTGIQIGQVFQLDGLEQMAWPDHCVQGTIGAQFAADLDQSRFSQVIQKGTDPAIDSYSGFFDNGHRKATGLENYLDANQVKRVFVMGLATDYCVKFTALDALACEFETLLIQDGCRGVNLSPTDSDNAIDAMTKVGIQVINSHQVADYLTR